MAGLDERAGGPSLRGADWPTAAAARMRLAREMDRLGWAGKDVERAFAGVAYESDLYSGPGGGALFDRPTAKRVARFAAGGDAIPEWLRWIPLAIEREAVPPEDRWAWDRENVPEHADLRREREEDEAWSRTFQLEEEEVEMLRAYRALEPGHRLLVRAALALGGPAIGRLLGPVAHAGVQGFSPGAGRAE